MRTGRPRAGRRGSALVLVLVFTTALAMLALSAIYLTSSATILGRSYERERDLRYVAEAGLALGRSRLNSGAAGLPATGYKQIVKDTTLTAADGTPISDIRLSVYIGPTGGGAGSRGRFASVVAEVKDMLGGGKFVRRVELAEDSFARFAYFTDQELSAGTTVYFTKGDVVNGPVWSNDNISITDFGSGGLAHFKSDVGTAGTVINPSLAIFDKGYRDKQAKINLPDTASLSARLVPLARLGGLAFDPERIDTLPNMRIEFFAMDMNGDGDSTDANEGFFKVYRVSDDGSDAKRLLNDDWLQGNFRVVSEGSTNTLLSTYTPRWNNCGDWHKMASGEWRFFPLSVHTRKWFYDLLEADSRGKAKDHIIGNKTYNTGGAEMPAGFPGFDGAGYSPRVDAPWAPGGWETNGRATPDAILAAKPTDDLPLAPAAGRPAPRCYLGGDPHLVDVATGSQKGGADTTFYATNSTNDLLIKEKIDGNWVPYPGTVDARVAAARKARGMNDAAYVFPLHTDFNGGSVGVIHVSGSVGVSGVLNGAVTLYAQNSVVILDDLTYATTATSSERKCNDILGIISGESVLIADNGVNTPQDVDPNATPYTDTTKTYFKPLDDTPNLDLDAVVMALNPSFRVEGVVGVSTYQYCDNAGARPLPLSGCTGLGALTVAYRRPVNTVSCIGQKTGRGCLDLFGGVIQLTRGTVARSDTRGVYGFGKQYDYDKCAATNPPPFFPTIGRFIDNRYYEVDPNRFVPDKYFEALRPR